MSSPKGQATGRPTITLTPAEAFRTAIAAARAEGTDPSTMLLQLTRRDDASLRRDRTVPLEDIRYADGEMRFLGVKVIVAAASALVITPA